MLLFLNEFLNTSMSMDNNMTCKNILNILLVKIMKHYAYFLVLARELNKGKPRDAHCHCYGTTTFWLTGNVRGKRRKSQSLRGE